LWGGELLFSDLQELVECKLREAEAKWRQEEEETEKAARKQVRRGGEEMVSC
jgi:hypothetical protein